MRPLLREANNALVDVFGYCLVPIKVVMEKSQSSKSGIVGW